jgi:glutathione synthase/RimK-type ligase-like ATP-grasp enzyme
MGQEFRAERRPVNSARLQGVSGGGRDLLVINGAVFQADHSPGPLRLNDDSKVLFCGVDDIGFVIETGRTRVYETVSGRDLADFGLIQVASYPRPTAVLLSSISAYLEHRRRPAVNAAGISAPTKLYQLMTLAQGDLPVPPTIYLSRKLLHDSLPEIADGLGMPFVVKAISASGGRLNFLIESEVDFLWCVENAEHQNTAFLAQQFIPNNGTFRILMFGGEPHIIMHRCSTNGSHLTNTEQGGHATLFDVDSFDAEALEMSSRAARLMKCEVAGINMVQHKETRQWYFLEVTSSPAIATGAFAEEKISAYSSYLRKKLSHVF